MIGDDESFSLPNSMSDKLDRIKNRCRRRRSEKQIDEEDNLQFLLDRPERTAMINAILSNNIVSVQKLIENQEALNVVDRNGHSYLHLSAYFNKVEITQILIKAGLKVDSRDNSYLTPLHSACLNNAAHTAKLLVERGADLCARDHNWLTPLHICAATNALDCLNLLNRNPVYFNVLDKNGASALDYGCIKQHYDFVKNLLNNGADPKLFDNRGRTCLHYAVAGGDFRIIELILDQNVDINWKDNQGSTVLHLACNRSTLDCIKLLVNRGVDVNAVDHEGNNAFHYVLRRDHCIEVDEICQYLIDQGCDLKCVNKLRITPLHRIQSEGVILDTWIRSNYSLELPDHHGRTPLHIACMEGYHFLIELLIKNGANIRARDVYDRTTLHYSVQNAELKCVEILIKIDPDLIGLIDTNCCNSLHYAARLESDHSNIWSQLVNIYSRFDQKDKFGRTVHFYAAQSITLLEDCLPLPTFLDSYKRNLLFYTLVDKDGTLESCTSLEFILNMTHLKLDINQRDIHGRTCLHYAYLLMLYTHAESLLKHYASLYIEDNNGMMPIHYLLMTDDFDELNNLIDASLIDFNQNRYKVCLLQCAAYYGANRCLKILLRNNYRYHSSLSKSVEYAVLGGHPECVDTLLSLMLRSDKIKDLYESSALNIAAMRSDYTCFNRLLVNLEQCDNQDEHGRSTMMFALVDCNEKNICIDMLMKRNDCDLNAVDNEHRNVLFYSVAYDNLEMTKFFLKSGVNILQKSLSGGKTVIHLAALIGNCAIFRHLIENLKQNNIPYDQLFDNDGFNVMHYACYKGNTQIVQMIIDLFPEKNQSVESLRKVNYLHMAAYSTEPECINLILNHFGTEIINQKDNKGRNALHYLCMSPISSNSNQQTQQSFVENGSDLECNLHGVHPNHLKSYRLLMANHADINCTDQYGKTPLMIALQNDSCKLSMFMIDEESIDLKITDQTRSTSLHYACKYDNEIVGQKLVRKDFSLINLVDKSGRSALHYSASRGLFEMTKCLLFSGGSCYLQDSDHFTPALTCSAQKMINKE